MAFTNFETKEIHAKVIYFGPSGSGKTTNLKNILAKTSIEIQSGLLELQDEGLSTQFFDFLPLSLGQFRDFHFKVHLFTLPLNELYQTVPTVILKGVDGCVFVADSRVEALAENTECLKKVKALLTEEGYNTADIPWVIQYNKRDLAEATPVALLRQQLNPAQRFPELEAIAHKGDGVLETIEALAKQMKRLLDGQTRN
jgi:mutual gliding-motility protein MglA